MFYRFGNELEEISIDEINSKEITAGFITLDELEDNYKKFDISPSSIEACKGDIKYFRSNIEVYDNYSFGTLKITDAGDSVAHDDYIAFFVKENMFLIVEVKDENKSVLERFNASLNRFSPATITLEKLVYAFLSKLIDGDNKALEDKEFRINRLEEYVLKNQATDDFNLNLHHMKKELLILRNYYEQLIDVGEALLENENDLFFDNDLRYFKIFTDKVQRLRETVGLLSESLVQLGDAYKSTLEINQNKLMNTFTVVTTIFLPLTVITGWYGMNFREMPELSWKFGYIFIICASILVISLLVFIFKRKKWM